MAKPKVADYGSHGSSELDEDAAKLQSLGADPGPTIQDFGLDDRTESLAFPPMSEAPRDKRWIEASRDGIEWVRVRYYQTRVCIQGRVWKPVECWTTSDPPKFAHRVEGLIMWRECEQW